MGRVDVPGVDVGIEADLGAQFLLWEYATAYLGYVLGLNPFDQPDVESAKAAARGLLDARPEPEPLSLSLPGADVWLSAPNSAAVSSAADAWRVITDALGPSGYLSIHLYLNRLGGVDADHIRSALARHYGRPVTVGFGPRFLHSTGQFHKGGTPDGVFIQLQVEPTREVSIPGYPYDFATLITAQAAGDRRVLLERGRPVLTVKCASEEALMNFIQEGPLGS